MCVCVRVLFCLYKGYVFKPYVALKTSLVKTSCKTKSCNCSTDETILQILHSSAQDISSVMDMPHAYLNTFYFSSIFAS